VKATPLCLAWLASLAVTASASPPAVQLDAQAKRKLVERSLALHIGDTVPSVITSLGKPSYDQMLTPKQSAAPVGRSLKYYAVIWESGLVNDLHDQLVDLTFDASGRLQRIDIRVSLSVTPPNV
jgi:hypothetical protein